MRELMALFWVIGSVGEGCVFSVGENWLSY